MNLKHILKKFLIERSKDYRSAYIEIINEHLPSSNPKLNDEKSKVDFSDVEFEIDILKTVEINLDYILSLIFEKTKESKNIEEIKDEIIRAIRSSF